MKKLLISKNLAIVIASDTILIALSYFLSYVVRYDANLQEIDLLLKQTIIPVVIFKLVIFYSYNLYRGMWRYTGIKDMYNVMGAVLTSFVLMIVVILMMNRFEGFSRSVFVIDAMFTFIFITGSRLLIRIGYSKNNSYSNPFFNKNGDNRIKKLIIVGAGYAGEKVAREICDNRSMKRHVIGFLDDDRRKIGRYIHGIRVLGKISDLNIIINQTHVDEILIAIPSASGKKIRGINGLCESTKIPYKTLPGMGEIINGDVSIKKMRDISYKDLLRRTPVRLENNIISEFLKNKCVLITGAGGSIGSELCRQVCRYDPKLIILFDSSEANLYSIEMDLKHYITHIKYRAVLGRVQDKCLVDGVLKRYKPSVIFHAAAYKHVPLIERNPWEAVFSNILGTENIVKAAIKNKVERFVLVSTDKAVRPTNVMGASKNVTEKILQAQSTASTKFMAVRFGNVIGSSGSVIPLFRQQIERGGPITVTHPDITRFFMTIEEAAQLILQAFTMGQGGEIYVLEMGTPVKIVDMAKDLICLSGKDHDIDIRFTGLRPGEKLYEELITDDEGIVKTCHEKILVLRNGNGSHEYKCINKLIKELVEIAKEHNANKLKCKLKEIVPEYNISDDECVI